MALGHPSRQKWVSAKARFASGVAEFHSAASASRSRSVFEGCVVHGDLSGHSTKRSFGLKALGASLLAFGMEPPFPMFPPGPSDVGVLDDAVEPAAFRA
jgi:hypothetical protein